jgi:hypothetical protein
MGRVAFVGAESSSERSREPGRRSCAKCDEVVERVLPLLPKRPHRIAVFDADRAPDLLRAVIADAEAFVTHGEPTVYLKKQGSTFQLALRGAGICDYALAAIVWHEMAHIEGADEQRARRREEDLWKQFIVRGRVDARRGLQYLALLEKRPPDSRTAALR